MNNLTQQQNNSNSHSNSNSQQSPHSMLSAATNSNDGGGKGQSFGSTSGSTASNFFQQQQGISRRSSDADIGNMDDIQFNASLDALLNGDQLGGASSNSSNNLANAGNAYPTQQPAMANSHQYGAPAPQQGTQQQQHQQQALALSNQLAGLPLASANQGALQLVPPGPHSAAQMSLSAGHAAATGAFHPGNPAPPTGLPQIVATHAVHNQTPFPWALSSNAVPVAPPSASLMSAAAQAPTSASVINASSMLGKHAREVDICPVSEDDGDRETRRQGRNHREQQRSHKITEQIAELREVLSGANVQFKPDKHSTLTKVVEYIKQLQERSQLLDMEHKKLIETISETNELVNNQYVPAYASGSDAPSISNDLLADGSSLSLGDESMGYVRGIDYKIAFQGCGIPLALSSIDGRFLNCNDTFLELTGYDREELLPLEEPGKNGTVSFSPDQDDSQKKNLSLFNLLCRDGMEQVFEAMSVMLKQPGSIGTAEVKPTGSSKLADFWSGPVRLCRQEDLGVKLNVTLVRTSRGRPKFFNCALTALGGEPGLHFDDQTTMTSPSQSVSNLSSDQQQTPSNEEEAQEDYMDQQVLNNDQPVAPSSNTGGG